MRNIKLKVICFVAALLMVGAWSAEAQHTYKFRDSLGIYTIKFTPHSVDTKFAQSLHKPLVPRTHELRLSTSWGATNYFYEIVNRRELNYYGDAYSEPIYFGPSHRYALVLDYGYWVNEWFSIGANFSWIIGHRNMFQSYTQKHLLTLREDNFSVMPVARFAWYRQGIVQLYSSVGIGLGVERWVRYHYGKENMFDVYCAFDVKPFGISVGRKWFGFAEVGYGARGVINVGFGCRINNKVK